MSSPPATACRFCGEGGELIKGAHRGCKNIENKNHIRQKRGIPPERWTSEVDRKTTCNTYNKNPRFGKSLDCEECRGMRVKETKRKSHNAYMRRRRAQGAAAAPPKKCLCGCGIEFRDSRRKYATPQCRPSRVKATAPAHRQAPKQFKQKAMQGPLKSWTTVATKATEPTEWRIVVPDGLAVTKLPPVGPQSRWE